MDQLNLWWSIGALTVPDESRGLQENDLVCIITSTPGSTIHRMLLLLKNEFGPFGDQLNRLFELQNCINDPNSTDYVVASQNGHLTKIAKEFIRIVDPEEFESVALSYFLNIDQVNLDTLSEFLTFFGCTTTPYIDSIFSAVYSGVTEAITRLQTAPFLQKEQERNIVGLIFQAFYHLLHHRSITVQTMGDPEFVIKSLRGHNISALQNQMMPSFAFSEVALIIFHGYIVFFQKLEDLYRTLFDITIENVYRKAAVRKAYSALEKFHSDKQITVNAPILLPNRRSYPKVVIISCIEAIEVIPVLNTALIEKGSRRNDTFETILANHSIPAVLERYYTIWSIVRFIRAVKNVREYKVNYRRAFRVVLVPPAEYDRELYSQVKPDMKFTVRLQLLEGEERLQEPIMFEYRHKLYNQINSLPKGFLQTWERSDKILKENLLTLMEEEEMHLAKFVTELIHDSESNAHVLFQIILETNKFQTKKVFESIWHTGVCWHLLIVCVEKCEGVRTLLPQYSERIHKKFGEATTSTMSFGTLQYYYHRLKSHFNEKQQKFIEKKIDERKEAEDCFCRYINGITDYTIDDKFRKFAKTHGYVFFTSFYYRFLNLLLQSTDMHQLEKDLIIFRDTAFQIPALRLRFADMNFKRQMGVLVRSTTKELPNDHVDHIFNYTWAQLHATDMIGRTKLEQFEKSSVDLIKRLGRGGQAEAYRARVINYPFEVVAKIAMDIESFYEISGELDSLMRTQSHPHVLHIYGYVVEFGDHIGIVMEYCKGGTVQDVIDDPDEVVDERRSLHWAIQAASGLLFLDQHDIIHRDVKPDNMLLDVTKSHLKISDLGLSKIVTEKKAPALFKLQTSVRSYEDELKAMMLGIPQSAVKMGMTSECGTEGYRAPEIFSPSYSSAIDTFSLGRSLWALIYRRLPSDTLTVTTWGASSNSTAEVPLPSFIPSDELRSLAGRMMNGNLDYRATMKEAYDELCELYKNAVKRTVKAKFDLPPLTRRSRSNSL